jgi:hypothetical protein
MKTVVYQSYRTHNVPHWIFHCMQIVSLWAGRHGFAYRFYDDGIFNRVPAWFKQRVNNLILPMSDLARLLVAHELLEEGFERVVWIDADVLIFDIDQFHIDVPGTCAFCKEWWLGPNAEMKMRIYSRVNNAVLMFTRESNFLDFYIESAQAFVRYKRSQIGHTDIGTQFLSRLHALAHFPLLTNVGMISPWLLSDMAEGPGDLTDWYMQHANQPIFAANLCGSMVRGDVHAQKVERVVQKLLASRGEILNQHLVKTN